MLYYFSSRLMIRLWLSVALNLLFIEAIQAARTGYIFCLQFKSYIQNIHQYIFKFKYTFSSKMLLYSFQSQYIHLRMPLTWVPLQGLRHQHWSVQQLVIKTEQIPWSGLGRLVIQSHIHSQAMSVIICYIF